MNNSAFHSFDQFLDHTKPTQFEAEQSLVILTCTILPGSHRKACRLLTIDIERRNLGHRLSVKRVLNKSECPVTASEAPVARKCS